MKCPTCRKGEVFVNPNPYNLKSIGDIHSRCKVCDQNFRPEPGFYFGGAVVSYPMMVIFCVLVAIAFHFIVGSIFDHFWTLMLTLAVACLLVTPLVFRYSRIIFLYIIFKYRGK